MLRRKLLLMLLVVAGTMTCLAVVALWLLQDLFVDFNQTHQDAARIVRETPPASDAVARLETQQLALTNRFRWLVTGVALGFLVTINVSVLLLLRAAGMILRPVDKLVEGSRELARERFDHRIVLGEHDEFDELADAYNRLAQQLQDNEQRKVETLHQVARTLNHELNNAIATIELQLPLLQRQAPDDAGFEMRLKQIRENLQRMNHVVKDLTQVRRVVLTDYVQGVKMLDLERSVQEASGESAEAPAAVDGNSCS